MLLAQWKMAGAGLWWSRIRTAVLWPASSLGASKMVVSHSGLGE